MTKSRQKLKRGWHLEEGLSISYPFFFSFLNSFSTKGRPSQSVLQGSYISGRNLPSYWLGSQRIEFREKRAAEKWGRKSREKKVIEGKLQIQYTKSDKISKGSQYLHVWSRLQAAQLRWKELNRSCCYLSQGRQIWKLSSINNKLLAKTKRLTLFKGLWPNSEAL